MIRSLGIALVFLVACGPTPRHELAGDDEDGGGAGGVDAAPEQPQCTPGATRPCYSGAAGTDGVGICSAGTETCSSWSVWGGCIGEVTPQGELCANTIDDNCNGAVDEDVDADGDGFTSCSSDCCDSTSQCGEPRLVNPGAFDAAGNLVDDDCDGTVDNVVLAACDSNIASNSSTGLDYARAIDLCQTTTLGDVRWGVISARLTLPSGTGTPNANQRSIRTGFGGTAVTAGSSFAVLSTGHAAAIGQSSPPYAAFQTGTSISTTSGIPADWLAAHGNTLPNAPGCPAPFGGLTARDPIMLELTIRTPTNARSFSLGTNFMSAEYPEWVCSAYNDFFVVLLDSTWAGQPANPADKNLATYTSPTNETYPVGVNLAHGNTGMFKVCKNGATGCMASAVDGTISTCGGTSELVGTGMDVANPPGGACGTNDLAGGGTGWLVTSGNVNGGEVIKLRIALWDTSDALLDSVSILDNFQWSVTASTPGTVLY